MSAARRRRRLLRFRAGARHLDGRPARCVAPSSPAHAGRRARRPPPLRCASLGASRAARSRRASWRPAHSRCIRPCLWPPGDVVALHPGVLPCDLALLRGEAIVDENMLTGESVPVRKVAHGGTAAGSRRYDPDADKACTLYGGTALAQARPPARRVPACLALRACARAGRTERPAAAPALASPPPLPVPPRQSLPPPSPPHPHTL